MAAVEERSANSYATADSSAGSVHMSWVQSFAADFTCCFCRSIAADPVMNPQVIACRDCAVQHDDITKYDAAPQFIRNAVGNLTTLLGSTNPQPATKDELLRTPTEKKYVRVNRQKYPNIGANGADITSPSPNRVRENQNTPTRPHVDTESNVSNTFQALNINVNQDAKPGSKNTTPHKATPERQPVPEVRNLELENAIHELTSEERRAREKVKVDEALFAADIQRKQTQSKKAIAAARPGSSKQIKVKADDCYEKGDYLRAIELYSQAITSHDQTSKLNVLHGNRSAANFMANRFDACIDDCLAVLRIENNNNPKICSRAVKAAVAKGDLRRAVQLYDECGGDAMSAEMQKDRARLEDAAATKDTAEANMGRPAGDEAWKMLVSEFGETVSFRLKYAESIATSKRFEKAAEVLAAAVGVQKTPEVAYYQARYLYRTGFEKFGQSRLVLEEFSSDEKCAALLQVLNQVDDGKTKGNNLFASRDFTRAIEAYTRAINVDSTNDRVLRVLFTNRAAAYKELGKYKEGIEDCSRAISLDPSFSKAFARRARCSQLLNDFDSAVRDFREAVRLDPDDKELPRELKMAEAALAKETEREKEYYSLLGVSRTATDAEIKQKYRQLSLKWHPDKCASGSKEEKERAERKFKAISEAYSTLSDVAKRREYDLKMDRERLLHRTNTFSGFGYSGSAAGGHGHGHGAGSGSGYHRTSHYDGYAKQGTGHRGTFW